MTTAAEIDAAGAALVASGRPRIADAPTLYELDDVERELLGKASPLNKMRESIKDVEARYDGEGYGTFKSEVADSVIALLEPFQSRFREIRSDDAELRRLLALGADKARETSQPTLETMYERMGFVRPR